MDAQKWKGDNLEPLLNGRPELDANASVGAASASGRPAGEPELWRITQHRIDLTHGCCGSEMETLDLRRVIDLHFKRNFWQMCCGRGTIVIHSDNDEFPKLQLTTFGTRQIFERLREAWSRARIATAIGDHDHHMHDGGHHG
ncbi:hypothetical protein WJX72_000723 [[Myrmecia] bisecta]|uniref:YdbS-like PH domain-containing protein n=1 Tax=[Myrmecia] bisecta TaxID=41462 RepID=A0AAW1PRL0_9CHLO